MQPHQNPSRQGNFMAIHQRKQSIMRVHAWGIKYWLRRALPLLAGTAMIAVYMVDGDDFQDEKP
jgi:hypothetical protein